MKKSYEYKINEYNINSKFKLDNDKIIKINKIFMLINQGLNELIIYDFNAKSFLDENIKLNKIITYYDFHCFNENILFVCAEKDILIYEIDENKKLNKLSIIKGNYSDVIFAAFNPFDAYIFLSISNYNIKIYDITNSLPINNIFLDELIKGENKIQWGKKDIGFFDDENIIYFEYNNFNREKIKRFNIKNIIDIFSFYFFNNNDDSLIIISKNNIDIIEKNIKVCTYKLNLNNNIISTFYFRKKSIIIIIYDDEIKGININNINYSVNEYFNFKQNIKYYISNPLYINENLLNENEICNIYQVTFSIIKSYSIFNNEIEENYNSNNKNKKEIKKVIQKQISDISFLISKENNEENNNFRIKKYFEIETIKNELIQIKKKSFLSRKKMVEDNLIQFENIEEINQKYIFLIKLLLNDNSNKNLLRKYLNFLKNNENQLEIIFNGNIEKYYDELDYYSKVFNKEENKIYFNIETKDQKEDLFILLNNLLSFDENDIQKFENYLIECKNSFENISYFNIPIDFSNEELFYYRNINLIKYYLKNLYLEILKNIEEKKIFENKNIATENKKNIEKEKQRFLKLELNKIQNNIKLSINYLKNQKDVKKINALIILLIFNSSNKEFEYGYNLISSNKIESNKLYEEQNFINNINNIKENDEYLIEFLNVFDLVEINLSLIKEFYKKILPLKCFKSIFLTLYGNDEYYPFEDQNFTDYFIDNCFEIFNLPLENVLGFTDKFSMKTYFIPFLSKINGICGDAEKKLLRNGNLVSTGNHEIGHNFVNIKFYIENCKISIETPRKNSLDFSEGGFYIDLALFGRILEEINLEQALYILNEKNYQKTFYEFQEGFNNIKKQDLIIEGVFKDLFKNINFNENFIKFFKKVSIAQKSLIKKEKKISRKIRNDVLGKVISEESYNKILKKFSEY